MKKRVFSLNCEDGVGELMITIIHTYAEAAYPRGCSPCGVSARESLETLAAKIKGARQVDISTRQRPMLTSATKWFGKERPVENPEVFEKLVAELERR